MFASRIPFLSHDPAAIQRQSYGCYYIHKNKTFRDR